MTKAAILGVKDWLLSSITQWLHWSAEWVLQTVGWPGIIAGLAGTLFLLSASVRAIRFLHSPKGLGVSGAITLAGLACTWWFWPEPALSTADKGPPAIEETKSEPDSPAETVLAAKPVDVDAAPVILASRSTPGSSVLDQPFLPIIPVMAEVGSLPPTLPAPHVPPIVIHNAKPETPHHAAKPPPAAIRTVHTNVPTISRGGFHPVASPGGFAHNTRTMTPHRQSIHDVNNAAAHGFDPFGFSMGGFGGYGHPMHTGGMGQMGGMHPGMGHTGHPGHH